MCPVRTPPAPEPRPASPRPAAVGRLLQPGRVRHEDIEARVGRPDGATVGRDHVRVAPLLHVSDLRGRRTVAVGHVTLVVPEDGGVAFDVAADSLWVHDDETGAFDELPWERADHLVAEIGALLADVPATAPADQRVAACAKTVCESSRNAVADLREFRYELELALARNSLDATGAGRQVKVVAALLQLDIIAGRAADQAREAVREGLWLYVDDDDAYHAHRSLHDPSLASVRPSEQTSLSRPWMRVHDAAVRQCTEMGRQLEQEHLAVSSLLAAASSISGAREAEAQGRFNVMVGVVSICLGVPALVLGLYGADSVVPFESWRQVWAFLPIAVVLLGSLAIATFSPAGSPVRQGRWLVGSLVLLVLTLLVFAGLVVPAADG